MFSREYICRKGCRSCPEFESESNSESENLSPNPKLNVNSPSKSESRIQTNSERWGVLRGVLVVVLGAISPVWLPPPLERAREGLTRWRKRLLSPGNGDSSRDNTDSDSSSSNNNNNNSNRDGDDGNRGDGVGGRGRHDESKVCVRNRLESTREGRNEASSSR